MKEKILFYFIFSITMVLFVLPSFCNAESNTNNTNISPYNYNSSMLTNNSLNVAECDCLLSYLFPNNDTYATVNLYVNHEACIMNNYNIPQNVTIYTHIPIQDYKNLSVGNHTIYPIFGYNAMIVGNTYPSYFNPKSLKVLGDPEINIGDMQVNYTWNNVEIDPMCAVEVAYDNYYGNGTTINNNGTINLPGANVISNFSNIGSSYIMNFTLKNTEKNGMNPGVLIFFPNTTDGNSIINISDISANSLLTVEKNTIYFDGRDSPNYSDGYTMASNVTDYLGAGNSTNYVTIINGTVNSTGKIYPSLVLNYEYDMLNNTDNVTRIWTPIQVVSEKPTNQTKFYDYQVSMFLPAYNNFYITQNRTANSSGTPTPATSALMAILIIGIVAYIIKNKE